MAISLPFQPGAYGVRADYNFVNSLNMHKPEYDEELTYRYGDQGLYGFMKMIGAEKAVSSLKYSHFEEDRSYPKIKATVAVAPAAGAVATFALDAAATLAIGQQDPYTGTATKDVIVPRVNDTIMVKPSAGVTSAGAYIKCLVLTVDKAAGTFTAQPLNAADTIPAIAVAQEIVIFGSAHGEGSGQPEAMSSSTTEFSNTLQIIKDTFKITGTEKNQVLWSKVKGENGKTGFVWRLKSEKDTYNRFMTKKELTLMLGEQLANPALANTFANQDEPLTLTEGLIPFILSQGNQINYSQTSGFDKQNMNTLAKTLDKQKGSKVNMLVAGMNLSIQMDETLADHNVNGAITYGNYSFNEEAKRNFEFDSFKIGGYRFDKKVFDVFNDLQTLGAEGFGFTNEAIVIPMDKRMDKGSGEYTQSLRTRYLVDPQSGEAYDDVTTFDGFKQGGNGEDNIQVRYKSACGFEGFAGNRWAYIK